MDEVIREIIKIDKETLSMKQRYEKLLRDKENELKKTLADLEKDYIEEDVHRVSANSRDITAELKHLDDIYKQNMHNMDEAYKKLKGQLIESIWNDIF